MLISKKGIYMANKKRYYKNRAPKRNQEGANEQTAKYSETQLTLSLEDLGIGESTCELLSKNRILTAADLVKRTEKDMYKVQGLNKKILFEVKDALRAKDMELRPDPQKQNANAEQKQNATDFGKQNEFGGEQKGKSDKKKPQNDVQKRDENDKETRDKSAKSERADKGEKTRASKFGLSDRVGAKPQQNKNQQSQKQNDKNKQKNVEKLTEPLKPGQWRKVLKGGKWGYSNGFKIVIPTIYDEIFAFKEGLASVEIDEKCGYIDEENNIVIPLDYDTAMSFSEGLAMVCRGEKCGYINKNNEVIIPFEYDAGTPFENGEAKIKKDGKWGTITVEGKITWI